MASQFHNSYTQFRKIKKCTDLGKLPKSVHKMLGGGAENRTPVHTKLSTRRYRLSQRSGFGADRFADQRGRS
nr:MAG TPA: hypothetical protein [Caudoviricetes sp.]